MSLIVTPTELAGVKVIQPDVFKDDRGYFLEIYHHGKYSYKGLNADFVQDNHSHSHRGVIRGLHYQLRHPQDKLIYVLSGEILDVAVDIRRGSPTFGKWCAIRLSAVNRRQLFIPKGFAHGFSVLSDTADVIYKCTDLYAPGDEFGIFWADPELGIDWQVDAPVLSEKDRKNPRLSDMPAEQLPLFDPNAS